MASGGSRGRSGPAPDPTALKRDRDAGEWLELPMSGRVGDVPDWPLSETNSREVKLWADQWGRPQAIVWERNDQILEVAIFVRNLVEAESPRAPVNSRTLLKQQMESLGLTVPGLRANRWRIVDEVATSKSSRPRTSRPSARDRLKVVEGGKTA